MWKVLNNGTNSDYLRKTEDITLYNESDFVSTRAYNGYGNVAAESGWGVYKSTDKIAIKKGQSIILTTTIASNTNYPPILIYDNASVFLKARTAKSGEVGLMTISHTFEQDGYFIAQTEQLANPHYFKIKQNKEGYLTTNDSTDIYGKLNKKSENHSVFNSMFRTPSLSTGGVVSFIDDDGRSNVYSELYPLLKSLDVPFGVATVPNYLNTNGFMTTAQLLEIANDKKYVEILNHTLDHINLSTLTAEKDIHYQVSEASKWFGANGINCKGFVLPNGGDNHTVRKIIQQYYNNCYDFGTSERVETFATIQNESIRRTNFAIQTDRLAVHKAYVDTAVSQNGWLVITTHVGLSGYSNETLLTELQELITYIKSSGAKILLPSDAFQIFGNIVENDSGFKIQANGKIVGAT